MTEPIFRRIALIGIGLIGASIALAARRAKAVEHIAVNSRTAKTLVRAEELQLGDSYQTQSATRTW
jgi:cyclohexadieny/prephenate dehydrogenase